MSIQPHTIWFIAAAIVLVIAFAQWQIMSKLHAQRLAAERARHQQARQSAATLLQGAHQQTAMLQRELAAVRQARRSTEPKAPIDDRTVARERLNRMLDEALPPTLPAHGFADTQPSGQFTASTFALLQPSTAGAA